MKRIEIKGVVKMYNDGIASSYTQILNIIAKADNVEDIKEWVGYLKEFSLVMEFFVLKISSDSFTIWQCGNDEEITEILTVKFE